MRQLSNIFIRTKKTQLYVKVQPLTRRLNLGSQQAKKASVNQFKLENQKFNLYKT